MTGLTLTLLVAVGLTGTARTARAEPLGALPVLVHVTTQAAIPPSVLSRALGEAQGKAIRERFESERAQPPTLNLELRNEAEVSTSVLAEAKETLTRIYRIAGIRLQWHAAGGDFTIIVRPPPHPDAVRDVPFALGYAPGTKAKRGLLAFVLADRVENLAKWLGVPHHVVLGMAMAHEVGHLLLPYNSHTSFGIMRRDWTQTDYDNARLGLLLFTAEQAQLMRDQLSIPNP